MTPQENECFNPHIYLFIYLFGATPKIFLSLAVENGPGPEGNASTV